MGPRSLDFALKAKDNGLLNPKIVPHHADIEEMERDVNASEALTIVERRLAALLEKIADNPEAP